MWHGVSPPRAVTSHNRPLNDKRQFIREALANEDRLLPGKHNGLEKHAKAEFHVAGSIRLRCDLSEVCEVIDAEVCRAVG
jgi:hypothetical protein